MFSCNCGRKPYKTKKPFLNHQEKCEYGDLDFDKIVLLGNLINDEIGLFRPRPISIRKRMRDENETEEEAKKHLTIYGANPKSESINKYRKSLWVIYKVWKEELLISEYREFIKWAFKTYKDIALISMKSMLSNTKVIYRFNLEHTASMIGRRIDDSLIFIHENHEYVNDFEFVEAITTGNVSMYYVLFNDWLAAKWFGRLDQDLQKELEDLVDIASKTVLERLKQDEFMLLQKLACTDTPKIYDM